MVCRGSQPAPSQRTAFLYLDCKLGHVYFSCTKRSSKVCQHVDCRHSALGSHDLSVLLAIKDSKQLHLHLRGITVPQTHVCLSLMDQPFQLAPVPIGERDPPRQTYCLRNGGPAELPYSIDTAPLQQLIKLNYGYEVTASAWLAAGVGIFLLLETNPKCRYMLSLRHHVSTVHPLLYWCTV